MNSDLRTHMSNVPFRRPVFGFQQGEKAFLLQYVTVHASIPRSRLPLTPFWELSKCVTDRTLIYVVRGDSFCLAPSTDGSLCLQILGNERRVIYTLDGLTEIVGFDVLATQVTEVVPAN